MKIAHSIPAWISAGCLCLTIGCAESAPQQTAEKPSPTEAKPESIPAAKSENSAPTAVTTTETSAATTADPATPTPEATGKPFPTETAKVTLGDPSLTVGIPGDEKLTIAQIQAWLDTPGIHDPLEVELPFGLSLAASKITGLDVNPMTRAKIELGRQLYFDSRLCADATVSCASCHHPDQGYGAHTRFGVGIGGQEGGRNSPVSYNRILSGAQFWDGRAASLEEQAKGPIANPIEMGNTHEACVKCVDAIDGYKMQFEAIYGPDSVNIDTVAQAIATFERSLVTGPAPYDYYAALKPFLDQYPTEEDLADLKEEDAELYAKYEKLKADSDAHPMSESAIRGQALFFGTKANCTACHAGANFADELYHNIGVGMEVEKPDLGRYEVTKDEKDQGAFKTPTIRNITQSAPYMHDGSQKTLLEVVEWYAKGGHPNPTLSDKIKKLDLTDQDKADLVAFMEACTGEMAFVERERLPE